MPSPSHDDPSVSPAPASRPAAPGLSRRQAGEPLSPRELRRALTRPDLLTEHVLGSPGRLAGNLVRGESLWLVCALLLATSALSTVPYSALSPVRSAWKVAALYTGSLAICVPCLFVFLQFLGFRSSLPRVLALALVATATAALFTFGFFPVIWFVDATTRAAHGAAVTPATLSGLLLTVSLALGLAQMGRCLFASRRASGESAAVLVPVAAWVGLLLFIVWRMALVLGIRG